MELRILKENLLKNPKFREEYFESKDLFFLISEMVKDTRIKRGFTQKQLARRLRTRQSSIARLERGRSLPSIRFLQKIAKALGTSLVPPKFASVGTETKTRRINLLVEDQDIISNWPEIYSKINENITSYNEQIQKIKT